MILLGILAAVWGMVYALGGVVLWPLAAVGFGLRLAVLSLAVVAATLVWLLVAGRILYDLAFPHRLVLDREAVRYVRGGPFGEVVKAHIPYRNVAKVTSSRNKQTVPLALELHDPNDPDTRISLAEGRGRVALGLSYVLPAGWDVDIHEVTQRLKRRCKNLVDT